MGKLYPLNVYQIILLYPVGFYTWQVLHLKIEHFESVNRKVVKRYVELFNRAGGKVNVRVSKQPSYLPYKIRNIGEGLRVQFLVSGNSQLVREFERLKSEDSYVLRHTVLKLTVAKILYLLQVIERQNLLFQFWKKQKATAVTTGKKMSGSVKRVQRLEQRWRRQQQQQKTQAGQPSQRVIARLQAQKLELEQKRRFRRFQREKKETGEQPTQQDELSETKQKSQESEEQEQERKRKRKQKSQESEEQEQERKRKRKRKSQESEEQEREGKKPELSTGRAQTIKKKSPSITKKPSKYAQKMRKDRAPASNTAPEQTRLKPKKKFRENAGWLSTRSLWAQYGDLKWSKALYRRFPQYLEWTWTFRNWFRERKSICRYRRRRKSQQPRPQPKPRPRYNDTVHVNHKFWRLSEVHYVLLFLGPRR
jgi:ribosomal protein S6